MDKQSSLVGIGAALAANEAAFAGLRHAGKKQAPQLLGTGIDLGKNFNRIGPKREGSLRNLLGNKQMAPYDAGQQIGFRSAYMEPDKQYRFIQKTIGMGAARAKRLEESGEKVKDPVLNALKQYNVGKGTKETPVSKFLKKNPAQAGRYGLNEKYTSNFIAVPGALFDHRMAVRPILREVKKDSRFANLDQKMQGGKLTQKPFNFLKDYYD